MSRIRSGKPYELQEMKIESKKLATVVSVFYVAGSLVVRYVSDNSIFDGSEIPKATLEDAYIFSLGGIKS